MNEQEGQKPAEITVPATAKGTDRPEHTAMQGSAEWDGTWNHARKSYGDAAAWALVTFFLVTLGVVAGCIAAALTRPRGMAREHALIDEVLRNEDKLAKGPAGRQEGESWEKPGDWWKGDGK